MAKCSFSKRGSELRVRPAVLAGVLMLSLAAPAVSAAATVYKGRMFTGGGAASPAAVNVRIVVDSTTTVEEAARLNETIGKGDWDAVLELFRSMPKGSIQFTGAAGLKISCGIITEEVKPDGGSRVVLVARGQPVDPYASRRFFGPFIFLVVALDLDASGKGEGKAYDEASFKFTADGKAVPEGSVSTPKVFSNIRREK